METVKLTIDNRQVEAPVGSTILEAAKRVGIKIPTLCAWPEINHTPGACRVCMTEVERRRSLTEVEGQRSMVAACVFPVFEGMIVHTNTEKVRKARKMVVELLLANHPQECNHCVRNGNCELQKVAEFVGLKEVRFPYTEFLQKEKLIDHSSPAIVRDNRKCIECHRCVTVCEQIQTVSVLTPAYRGSDVKVVPAFDLPLIESNCVACGQCILACPVGALYEKDDVDLVWAALQDPTKHVIVQE